MARALSFLFGPRQLFATIGLQLLLCLFLFLWLVGWLACLFACLFVCSFVCVCLFVCFFVRWLACWFVCLFVCLFVGFVSLWLKPKWLLIFSAVSFFYLHGANAPENPMPQTAAGGLRFSTACTCFLCSHACIHQIECAKTMANIINIYIYLFIYLFIFIFVYL